MIGNITFLGMDSNANFVNNGNGLQPHLATFIPTKNEEGLTFSNALKEKSPTTLIDHNSIHSNKSSLIDEWPQQTDLKFLAEGFELGASHKKGGQEERKDGGKNNKRTTNTHGLVFHHRQGSGDLYTKLQHFESEENSSCEDNSRRNSSKTACTTGMQNKYVVTGYGLWEDFDDLLLAPPPREIENPSFPTKFHVENTGPKAYEYDKSPFNILEGILPPHRSSSGGGGGVLGLKEWYHNRNLVSKATSREESPPKPKYLQKLVLSSWKHNGFGARGVR